MSLSEISKDRSIYKNTVFCDLDGVLADFNFVLLMLLGRHVGLGALTSEEKWKIVNELPNFYRHLPKMPDADLLWDFIVTRFSHTHNIEILTAVPRKVEMPTAELDKREWFAEQFDKDIIVKIGPFSHEKKNHCRPGDILIDDRWPNIKDWTDAGGIGIHHKSVVESIIELEKLL